MVRYLPALAHTARLFGQTLRASEQQFLRGIAFSSSLLSLDAKNREKSQLRLCIPAVAAF